MSWILLAALFIVALGGFFAWANWRTKKQHAAFAKNDVIAAIKNVLSSGRHDEWDLFLAWPVADSYLESVRQRCIAISKEFSGTEKGKDIATSEEAKLRVILNELTTHALTNTQSF